MELFSTLYLKLFLVLFKIGCAASTCLVKMSMHGTVITWENSITNILKVYN